MIVVTREPLDTEAVTAAVREHSNGGIAVFLGTTRDNSHGRGVLYLEYEAYEEMALAMLERIAGEIRDRWDGTSVSIAHRFGKLEIGEISLVVAVGSPHRVAAFEACQYTVDRIKQDVPIWKKEVFADGEIWVGREGEPRPVSR